MASKNKKNLCKQKTVLPNHMLPPKIKISDAILRLSEPLRRKCLNSERVSAAVAMTVLAWNISLFPKDKQTDLQEKMIKKLHDELSGVDVSFLSEEINRIITRKKLDYPNNWNLIVNYQINYSESGEEMSLTVATMPIK